uniref:ARID domain-containing protein n=1 Tax=Timema monikensis TaxID=170555 RepID=A0A7R9HQR2_9NEOP|nr:unnamed protein product [Timema monikensis]
MAKILNKDPATYQRERDAFIRDLQHFHETRGTPFRKIPKINGHEIDLYLLYVLVTAHGGWVKIWDPKHRVLLPVWVIILRPMALSSESPKPILWDGALEGERSVSSSCSSRPRAIVYKHSGDLIADIGAPLLRTCNQTLPDPPTRRAATVPVPDLSVQPLLHSNFQFVRPTLI